MLPDGSLYGAFEFYASVPNAAMLRMVQIQLCPKVRLPALTELLRVDRLAFLDADVEFGVLDATHDALCGMLAALTGCDQHPQSASSAAAGGSPTDEAALLESLRLELRGQSADVNTTTLAASSNRRLQCAAHIRAVERSILEWHIAHLKARMTTLRP